jgi:formylglycine-generating enzyme
MIDIFISYAREDQERVRPIVKELEQRNWSVFWDLEIPPGDNWSNYIGHQLSESRCVVVFWSNHSITSKWVKKEAGEGENRDILIPVLLENVEPPFPFKDIHAADLSRWKNNASHSAFQSLLGAIESKISSASPHIVKPAPKSAERRTVVPPVINIAPPYHNKSNQPERLFPEIQRQQAVWAFIVLVVVVIGLFYFTNHKTGNTDAPPVVPNSEKVVSGNKLPAATNVVAETVPLNFVPIQGGMFTMGSPTSELNHQSDEAPQHQVRLSAFYMSRYEVTVGEFRKFIEASGYRTDAEKGDGSYFWNGNSVEKRAGINWHHGVSGRVRPKSEENHPVVHVSWNDAVEYCKWLSRTTGKNYRLPTEAEWEYACRAGNSKPFNTGDNLTTSQANYDGNYPYNNNQKGENRQNTVPVNSFAPNAWGLYNMHGNVWELCSDWYGNYGSGTVTNPAGPETGSYRVIRGGSWNYPAEDCRSAYRSLSSPDIRYNFVGFRPVFVP